MVFLSRINLTQVPYWNSIAVVLLAAPAALPYMISAIYSWHVVGHATRVRAFLFVAVLAGGTLLTDLLLAGGFGIPLSRSDVIPLFLVQGFAFVWAAELLLNVA